MGGRRYKKPVSTDYFEIIKMSKDDQIKTLQTLTKRANTRIRELEKKGHGNNPWALGKARSFLKAQGLDYFYQGKKYDDKKMLKRTIQEVTAFINAESSTVKGIKAIGKRRFDTFASQHDLIDSLMANNPKLSRKEVIEKYKDSYFEFLQSKQFQGMRSRIASDQLLDDFAEALKQGYTLKEIQEQYTLENKGELTIDQIQERFNRAPWLMK